MGTQESFGQRVKELRISQGWSQEEFAYKAELDRTYVSDIESGKRNISLSVIEKIAKAFKIEIKELFP